MKKIAMHKTVIFITKYLNLATLVMHIYSKYDSKNCFRKYNIYEGYNAFQFQKLPYIPSIKRKKTGKENTAFYKSILISLQDNYIRAPDERKH